MATQAEVAAHLDVSRQIVSKLCADGVLPKAVRPGDYDLDQCRVAYIQNLREKAAGRLGQGSNKLVLVDERARHASEAADALAIKNAEARRELLSREVVLAAVRSAFGNVRSKLLALPTRLAPLVVHLKTVTEVEAKLTEIVHEALAQLATTEIVAPVEAEGDAPDTAPADTGGTDGPEPPARKRDARVVRRVPAAAKADGKSVGRRKPGTGKGR